MSLFVADLGRASRKEVRASLMIHNMGILQLMNYVQQVKEDKMRDKEVYINKKSKTYNAYKQQKGGSNQP